MIITFSCKDTERVFRHIPVKRFLSFQKVAERKLKWLAAAVTLNDLRLPQGNRLEALRGDRIGQHSIRINNQWRVCFVWIDGNAYDVEIVDYH